MNVFSICADFTISYDLKLPVCKNYMNFAYTVGIHKYHHFGENF